MNSRVLYTTSNTESKRQMLIRKVRAMADLAVGFSFGEGVPIEEAAIETAEDLITLASGLELDADVFPNTDGGCAVVFYRNEDSVEASISPDGRAFDLRVEHGIGFQFEDVSPPQKKVSEDKVYREIINLWISNENIWKLYASSTSGSSTEQGSVFETQRHTEILQGLDQILPMAEGGSQSSRPLAHV